MEYAWYQTSPFYDNKEVVKKGKTRRIVEGMPDTPRRAIWLKDLEGKPIRYRCYALDNFFVLNHNGEVSPCLSYTHISVGNIKHESFKEILSGVQCKKVKKEYVKPCNGCLNSWAFTVSQLTRFLPYFWYYLRHPKALWGRK
jgi:MoaA/NifB/PqqE/SkfB family radical SAM enzyme